MKNPKTTLSAILAIVPTILQIMGVPIPDEVGKAVEVIGVFLIGVFSKDNNNIK